MALIDENLLVVALTQQDRVYDKIISRTEQVQVRCDFTIGCARLT